uniref:1,4-alpha-glucan branching protein domain-containing protein n=1 Tax=Thermococcus sp. TaxID=35749 RepID=UPI0026158371
RGIIVSPYDTELFGHWWFEGIMWLGRVLELMESRGIEPITLSRFLEAYSGERYEIEPPEGSWGANADHSTWWNPETAWTWEHVYRAEDRMVAVASRFYGRDALTDRAIEQLARELLILEASDWQFLISTGQAREYAARRVLTHSRDFHRLANEIVKRVKKGEFNAALLEELEERDNPFKPVAVAYYVSENPPKLEEHVEPPELPAEENSGGNRGAKERAYATAISSEGAKTSTKAAKTRRSMVKARRTKKAVSKKRENRKKPGRDLLSIKGIGPKTLAKLKGAGIESTDDLKRADLEELAKKTGISIKRLRKFVKQIP